jgi:hypothetical protein
MENPAFDTSTYQRRPLRIRPIKHRKDRFWMRDLHLGRLALSIVRNDAMCGNRKQRMSFSADSMGGQVFFTFRLDSIFINLDWI